MKVQQEILSQGKVFAVSDNINKKSVEKLVQASTTCLLLSALVKVARLRALNYS